MVGRNEPVESPADFDDLLCRIYAEYMGKRQLSSEQLRSHLRMLYRAHLEFVVRPRVSAIDAMLVYGVPPGTICSLAALLVALAVSALLAGFFSTPIATKGWCLLNAAISLIAAFSSCLASWARARSQILLCGTAALATAIFTTLCQNVSVVSSWEDGIETLMIARSGYIAGAFAGLQVILAYLLGRHLTYSGTARSVDAELATIIDRLVVKWTIRRQDVRP